MTPEQLTEQFRLTNMAVKRLAQIVDELSVNAYRAEETVVGIMLDEQTKQ